MAIGATEPAHLREEIELLRAQIKSDRILLPGKTAKLLFIQQPCTHYPSKIWTQGIPDFTHLERDGIAPSWSEPPGNYRSTLRCRTEDGEDLACYAIYLDGYERAKEKFEQHAAAAGELLVPDAMVPGSEFIKELFEFCRLQKRLAWAFNEQPGHPETRRHLAWLHDLYDAFVSFLTAKLDGPPKSQTVIRDQATDAAISTSSLKAEASHHLPDSVAAVRGAYEWALSEIDGADGMTISELFYAIQAHPLMEDEYLDRLPDNPGTFGKYLRRAGIRRYNVSGNRTRRTSRRPRT